MAHRSSLLLRTMTTTSAVPNPPDLIKGNLQRIAETVKSKYESAPPSKRASACPRLVAVSKTKHKADVISLYQAGHRHFGENYVQVSVLFPAYYKTRSNCRPGGIFIQKKIRDPSKLPTRWGFV